SDTRHGTRHTTLARREGHPVGNYHFSLSLVIIPLGAEPIQHTFALQRSNLGIRYGQYLAGNWSMAAAE
ncbi:MAG: hypothetical protein HQ546_05940, partial [Planctomycetes bacterium]|nr:hypothetical protein [Planctomycetota bacterium]